MKCPFCISGVENSTFAGSGEFIALYNIAPILPGHSLIVPRKHIKSLLELEEGELTEMMSFSKKVSVMLMKVFRAEAFNWSLQDGLRAGQTIAHLHLHIVLRFRDDMPDPGNWYPKIENNYKEILDSASRPRIKPGEMKEIVTRLKISAEEEGLSLNVT